MQKVRFLFKKRNKIESQFLIRKLKLNKNGIMSMRQHPIYRPLWPRY